MLSEKDIEFILNVQRELFKKHLDSITPLGNYRLFPLECIVDEVCRRRSHFDRDEVNALLRRLGKSFFVYCFNGH